MIARRSWILAFGMGMGLAACLGPTTAVAMPQPSSPLGSAGSGLLLSTDGEQWAPELTDGLFRSDLVLVPGTSLTADLWVRNTTDRPAVLQMGVSDVDMPESWSGAATLTIRDMTSDLENDLELDAAITCGPVLPMHEIPPQGTLGTVIKFTLADLVGQEGQNQRMALVLRVTARDAAAGSAVASSCAENETFVPVFGDGPSAGGARTGLPSMASGSGTGPLAFTGSPFVFPVAGIALSAVIVGGAVGTFRRRDRSARKHAP